ncbi:MAG: hypothetical protein ACJ74O_13430 [Frankiaceae bacterium]
MTQLILPIPAADRRSGDDNLPADLDQAYAALTALTTESNAQDNRLATLEGNAANAALVQVALVLPAGFTAATGFGAPSSTLVRPGLAHVHGIIDAGVGATPAAGTLIATIAAAHRPTAARRRFCVTDNGSSTATGVPLLIGVDGTVKTQFVTAQRYLTLDLLIGI